VYRNKKHWTTYVSERLTEKMGAIAIWDAKLELGEGTNLDYTCNPCPWFFHLAKIIFKCIMLSHSKSNKFKEEN